ncbi:alpha/beta fold hydrolase [Peribacillus sp. RS7]|jgi:pimeloyl-ACP methyl ester carboxylesterase|uniref:alpha/beta fold hydrolase n=1 Tax=Peribacillus sp. RS7 TaxID=3242679 RepID=UPI0035BEB644
MPISHIEESSIHYLESGEGKALVILHGWGNNSQSWRQQLGQLDDEFRVIAWDAPGYGESSAGYRFVAFSLSNLNQMDILLYLSRHWSCVVNWIRSHRLVNQEFFMN